MARELLGMAREDKEITRAHWQVHVVPAIYSIGRQSSLFHSCFFYRMGLTIELKDLIVSQVFHGKYLENIHKSLENLAHAQRNKILKEFRLYVQWYRTNVDESLAVFHYQHLL